MNAHQASVIAAGDALLHDPHLNKGTAFTEAERDALGLRGLLPPRVHTLEEQKLRVLANVRSKESALEKYVFLIGLQDRNETLFYRLVMDYLEEMTPLIYTPTVGQACMEYSYVFRRPRGLFVSCHDKGHIADVLRNWPQSDVRAIVVTDGGRILGLGDLGAQGMGIPVGKLSLYTACAGLNPLQCLPITLDLGTDNQHLLTDPLYIGVRRPRLTGAEYDEMLDEFMEAVAEVFPRALVQFEDFANAHAWHLLHKYRDRACCFNDDIQGTAAVALAGIQSALRVKNERLADQKLLFLGAGEAGAGIGELCVVAMQSEGLSESEARRRCWFVDSTGLVVRSRDNLAPHKVPFAHDYPFVPTFAEAVRELQPTALIGVAAQPRTFTQPIVEMMAKLNERPIIFALSNPTSKAECTAEEAYTWSRGRALYASGSPFPRVTLPDGRAFVPSQGNNVYIFPGVGLAAVTCGVRRITEEMFFAAARALARQVSEDDLAEGRLYPPLSNIREVSLHIAAAVAEVAYEQELADVPRPDDLVEWIRSQMYEPVYREYA